MRRLLAVPAAEIVAFIVAPLARLGVPLTTPFAKVLLPHVRALLRIAVPPVVRVGLIEVVVELLSARHRTAVMVIAVAPSLKQEFGSLSAVDWIALDAPDPQM